MIVEVYIVDDIEDIAINIKNYILKYESVLGKLFNKQINFNVTIESGLDVYEEAYKKLSQEHSFHLILIDEELNDKSGSELISKTINYKLESVYVHFSRHIENYKKSYSNNETKFICSKDIKDISIALLIFERDILFEKIFGYRASRDIYYSLKGTEYENNFDSFTTCIHSIFNRGLSKLEKGEYNSYNQFLSKLSILNYTISEAISYEIIIEEQDAEKNFERLHIPKPTISNFIFIKKNPLVKEGKLKKDYEEIYYFDSELICNQIVRKSLSSFKKANSSLFCIRHGYVFNTLWMRRKIDTIEEFEILNSTNKKVIIKLPVSSQLRDFYDSLVRFIPFNKAK